MPLCSRYYGWLRRYEDHSLDGLKDRCSRPQRSPRVTQAEVIEKIAWGVPAWRLTVAPYNSRSA